MLKNYNECFEKIIELFTLSKDDFLRLKELYDEIGEWLDTGKELKNYGVEIIPQGSVALGTAIKPFDLNDDYDVDLLCVVNSHNLRNQPQQLKKIVGDRLDERNDMECDLVEGKRCWIINYTDHHVDILPCVPDKEKDDGSFICTKKEDIFGTCYLTHSTNPVKYKEWFFQQGQSAKLLTEAVQRLTMVEERTDLQKIVQLLKMHRNSFCNECGVEHDDKPISIIITTLAAKAFINTKYNNIFDLFCKIANALEFYITKIDNLFYVYNPVDSEENFADKWQQYPERKKWFFCWLDNLKTDVKLIKNDYQTDLSEGVKLLFGENIENKLKKLRFL